MWKSLDFNNLACPPNFAAGTHSTNEAGDALNISGRGKVESQQQVFHYVYTQITGDFVMTARLDGVDFAGFLSNQGRAALLLTPDITATRQRAGLWLVDLQRLPSFARSDRLAHGQPPTPTATSRSTGTGARYLKLTRTGNTYQAAASVDGGATYAAGAVAHVHRRPAARPCTWASRSARAATPCSASATFSDVQIRDPAGNDMIGTEQFHGRDRHRARDRAAAAAPRPRVDLASR